MNDLSPPHDVDAEAGTLGGMLISREVISDVLEILELADFYRPVNATIFDAISALFSKGEPADPITVARYLDDHGDLQRVGGIPYLHTLTEFVPTAANATYYARIVSDRAALRRLQELGRCSPS